MGSTAAERHVDVRSTARVTRPRDGALEAEATFPIVLFSNSVVMGGMEEHVIQLARGLKARGFPVAVMCSGHDGIRDMRDALTESGVDVHLLATQRATPFTAVTRVVALSRVLRRYHGGLLHLHFTGHTGGDLATLAARLAGLRAVVRSVHLPPEARAPWRDRVVVRLRDRQLSKIICVSEQTRREHLALLGRDERRCVVVHNGVDLERFNPDVPPVNVRAEFGIDAAAPIVGTVARLGEARKGIADLISAAAIVAQRRPDVRFLIVGEGSLRPQLEAQAHAVGLGPKIVFAGHRSDVPQLLAAMAVFASPSLYEACQYNLLEAMAEGRPVVTTPTGVAPEVVADGRSGRLVPIADSAAMANAIVGVLADPDASAMGRRAREVIAAHYSVDAMVDGIVGIYRDVA